ncbi:MAG: hypothetical protein KGD57_01860 [Candidatus Lokiarchaeota archaeon]|nr:hypothetical protein [Candidatus Lokiarchaeota archaeon]
MTQIFLEYMNTLEEKNITQENLENIFKNLLEQLSIELDINPVINNIHIEKKESKIDNNDIFSLGINRNYQNSSLTLEISTQYEKFYPFILLREIYYCFLPIVICENRVISTFINQIVEINLKKHESYQEWSEIIKEKIIDYDFLDGQFDRLEKFLEIQTKDNDSPIKFFFRYVRKNLNILEDNTADFYDDLFNQFVFKTSKSMRDDDIIETLRILIEIFYRLNSYKALHEYKEYFSKLKDDGTIKTQLSLRKFVQNLRWIKNFTIISPSYKINHFQMGVIPFVLKLDFHPKLSKLKVRKIIEHFPFLQNVRISENGFSNQIIGYEILPEPYVEDFLSLLRKFQQYGYITQINCIKSDYIENNLNLNYFREYHNENILINKNHKNYNIQYEIGFSHNLGDKTSLYPLTLLDFLILDRIRYYSITGFGFEPNRDSIKQLKSDLMNEILSQAALIKNLKQKLKILHNNINLKEQFLYLLDFFKISGSFFIKGFLENIILLCEQVQDIISNNPQINNLYSFQYYLKQNDLSLFSQYIFSEKIKKSFIYNLIPLYFNNNSEFTKEVEKYEFFSTLFKLCFSLKIFSLKAIEKIAKIEDTAEIIYSKKQHKLNDMYESYKLQELTNEKIEKLIEKYLKNEIPLIKPILINTIPTTHFAKYHISLTVRDTTKSREKINKLKSYFPRFSLTRGHDLISNEKLNHIDIYFPNIEIKEKKKLISILKNVLGEDLLNIRRMFFHGFLFAYSLKDYYDFENNKFFYTRDLFEQYFLFVHNLFPKEVPKIKYNKKSDNKILFKKEKNLDKLVEVIQDRNSREQIDFSLQKIYQLSEFHNNLDKNLLKIENYKDLKKDGFFERYIKSIKIIPAFQNFGFSNYYLWFKPIDFNKIDTKLLFANTFLSLKYPIEVDKYTYSFLVSYLFPFRNPNDKYINWLTRSKQIIGEYFFFHIKKIFHILHFNYNLSSTGWNLDAKRFKNYTKNLLYKDNIEFQFPSIRKINLSTIRNDILGPSSKEFEELNKFFPYKSINIKSFLGRDSHHLIEPFHNLLSQNLIFPYIELKNLGFRERFYLFIPEISKLKQNLLVKIFSFFNYVFIYEIEGEFYIKGGKMVKTFENGLFIELILPDCEFSEFENAFFDIFKQMALKKYMILHDLVDGNILLKHTYGDLDLSKQYNPLMNLKWNKKDKIWMNHKLFDEKFNFLYPELKITKV